MKENGRNVCLLFLIIFQHCWRCPTLWTLIRIRCVCIYIYICVYMCMYIYVYIYIYRVSLRHNEGTLGVSAWRSIHTSILLLSSLVLSFRTIILYHTIIWLLLVRIRTILYSSLYYDTYKYIIIMIARCTICIVPKGRTKRKLQRVISTDRGVLSLSLL